MQVGGFGGEVLAGEGELHGDVSRQGPGEAKEASGVCHERPLHLGQAEPGNAACHHEVAGEHDLGSTGHGRALNSGDQGLGAGPTYEAGEPAAFGGEPGRTGGDRLEVGTGAERRPVAAQDPDPQVGVRFEAVDRSLEVLGELLAHGIAGLRAVQRDDRHPTADLEGDRHADDPTEGMSAARKRPSVAFAPAAGPGRGRRLDSERRCDCGHAHGHPLHGV